MGRDFWNWNCRKRRGNLVVLVKSFADADADVNFAGTQNHLTSTLRLAPCAFATLSSLLFSSLCSYNKKRRGYLVAHKQDYR